MTANRIKRLLRKQPFQPVRLTLADGRQIEIRHPRQVLVTMRTLFIATGSMPRSAMRLATPTRGDDVAEDMIIVSNRQVIDAA